jgi:NADH:ubiquinone oxidoreductase subunit K
MSIEVILNSVNINPLASEVGNNNLDGNVFALYIIRSPPPSWGGLGHGAVDYRNRKSISLDELSEMKG